VCLHQIFDKFAGVAYWLGFGPPVRLTEFDSPHPLQVSLPCKHRWRCAGPVIRISQFESDTGLQACLRASEPVSCWPHKPCEWRSTRQPATSFGGVLFNGLFNNVRQGGRCGQGAGLKSRISTFNSCP
jgi:hypothetical protein